MIAAEALAFPAIALLAMGTPRQAHLLSPRAFGHPNRRRLRAAGALLLALSFALVLAGGDQARGIVRWIGAIGLEAIAIAIAFTILAWREDQ